MLWENLRSEEFETAVEKCNGVCAIPIGCVEPHGIHLPLGCDTIKAREFSVRAAEQEPVMVFPAMYFGELSGVANWKGTIILPPELICEILLHSCREIARNGFKKIVLVSSHGGNTTMLSQFVKSILNTKPDFLVYHFYQQMATPAVLLEKIDEFPYLTDEDKKILQDYVDAKKFDQHGGFCETGCLYDICPELVRLDKMDAVDCAPANYMNEFNDKGIFTPFTWASNFPNYYAAIMHYGMNERIARAIASATVERTAEAFRFLREETKSVAWHEKWFNAQP